MALLLVDNGTLLHDELVAKLPQGTVVCSWQEVKDHPFAAYHGVVLSGGSLFSVEGHERDLAPEMEQIRAYSGPLLGICYGMEVMAKAHGGVLERMETDHRGGVMISVETPDGIFGDVRHFSIYEHHQWRVRDIPSIFSPLAFSRHGCEAFRHVDLPQYGLQFHPEHVAETDIGKRILARFLAMTM